MKKHCKDCIHVPTVYIERYGELCSKGKKIGLGVHDCPDYEEEKTEKKDCYYVSSMPKTLLRCKGCICFNPFLLSCGIESKEFGRKMYCNNYQVEKPMCSGCKNFVTQGGYCLTPLCCEYIPLETKEQSIQRPTFTLGDIDDCSFAIPHRCPVCNGTGNVPNGFYTQTSRQYMSTSLTPETCRSCNGTGVVWGNKTK